ncbi:hypothetical protein I79_010187 [Cricetulus griseus]|uniref:Uncharacterized protein n=1 Tax=Cricetulus griseus TaxID=10029 RepID=G3HHS8_CRIGR|nr:hypothetical protein I79_010187 [Cricetulus griseus]ERE86086.1 hypothetical protein H671_2g4741 [Cricetulus griseus]
MVQNNPPRRYKQKAIEQVGGYQGSPRVDIRRPGLLEGSAPPPTSLHFLTASSTCFQCSQLHFYTCHFVINVLP